MINFFEKLRIRYLLLAYAVIITAVILAAKIPSLQEVAWISGNFWDLLIYFLVLLVFFYYFLRHRPDYKSLFADFKRKVCWQDIVPVVFMHYLFTIGSIMLLTAVLSRLSPELMELFFSDVPFASDTLADKIYLFLTACVMAPVVEELTFRGVLLSRLQVRWGASSAIVISSLIFGLLHSASAALGTVYFALFLSLIYLKTNNILITMLVHFVNNFIVSLYDLIFPYAENAEEIPLFSPRELVISCVVGTLLLLICIAYAIYYFRKNWPREVKAELKAGQSPSKTVQGTVVGFQDDWIIVEVKQIRHIHLSSLPGIKVGDQVCYTGERWLLQEDRLPQEEESLPQVDDRLPKQEDRLLQEDRLSQEDDRVPQEKDRPLQEENMLQQKED